MPETQTPDLEAMDSMPLEELKRLAMEEEARLAAQPSTQDPADKSQARDENGRFAKTRESAAPTDADPGDPTGDPDRKIYRRTIDLGGDAGAEVFEADSLEELVDKIAEGKKNATKKIREQAEELRRLRAAPPAKEKEFTPDEEFVYSQELLAKPTQAFKKLFQDVTGVDIDQFKTIQARNKAMVEAQDRRAIADAFIASHPDYVDSPKNGKLMQKWMGADFSAESFNKAYQELRESGLLETQSEEAHVGQEPTNQSKERIALKADAEVPPQRTRKASGLSANRPAVTPRSTEPSEDDLYDRSKYSLEDIRQMAIKAERNQR